MKRDWKLIRAILLEQDLSPWNHVAVDRHWSLCFQAKYLEAKPIGSIKDPGFMIVHTLKGVDVADTLRNEKDLDELLQELEQKGLGSPSGIVFWMLEQKQKEKLQCQPDPEP